MQNSWFSATKSIEANTTTLTLNESSLMTSSPSSPFLLQSITDIAQQTTNDATKKKPLPTPKRSKKTKEANPSTPEKPPPGKARKIRIYPNAEQREKLQQWIGTARWTYNECLRAIQNEDTPKIKKAPRARVPNNEAINAMKKPWIRETPYDIRDAAMDDLCFWVCKKEEQQEGI